MVIRTHGFNNKCTKLVNKRLSWTRKQIPWKSERWGKTTNTFAFTLFCSWKISRLVSMMADFYFWHDNCSSIQNIRITTTKSMTRIFLFLFKNSFSVTTSASLKPFPSENCFKTAIRLSLQTHLASKTGRMTLHLLFC